MELDWYGLPIQKEEIEVVFKKLHFSIFLSSDKPFLPSTNMSYTVPTLNKLSAEALNTDNHTTYCDAINSIKQKRRAFLLIVQALARIQKLSRTIQTSISCATVSMANMNSIIKILGQ